MMTDLWITSSGKSWRSALDAYEDVVAAQSVARLVELDAWYCQELPLRIAARERRPHLTLAELARATEWKMARGVWRAPNLILVRSNEAADVERTSAEALEAIPHPKAPIATLATLAGVGPATASAIVAAAAPETYPFFDELVAGQVPSLGEIAWTLGYYLRYADALRERAQQLGDDWTPVKVERALWANVGGKAGALP